MPLFSWYLQAIVNVLKDGAEFSVNSVSHVTHTASLVPRRTSAPFLSPNFWFRVVVSMFILNWFWDVLASLGEFKPMFWICSCLRFVFWNIGLMHKNAKILFLGLDNAGKTVCVWVLLKLQFGADDTVFWGILVDAVTHVEEWSTGYPATYSSS